MATEDLKRSFETLNEKAAVYTTLLSYYEGQQPLVYSTDRLQQVFQKIDARFSENWSAVVIDSEHERIHLREMTVAEDDAMPAEGEVSAQPVTETPSDRLSTLFQETELNLDADDVHKVALICGESYVFAWKDDELGIEAYYHDPRLCHVFYDPEHPRKKAFGAKWWIGADGKRYLNLYYPERIEYYVSNGKADGISSADAFAEHQTSEPNPFGEVPIFHFRIDRRKILGRLANVIDPQNAINKLNADMMVAAEFGAFMQRVIISAEDPGNLKNAPNHNWWLPAAADGEQPTSIQQLAATDLGNYLSAIDKKAQAIAIITRTPKHYFYAQGGAPSGEALIAMEAPLNKKAQSAIDRFMPTWAEVGAFLLKLDGVEVERSDVIPAFDRPETVQPMTEAQIRQTNVSAGIPLKTTLREQGWNVKEIEQMEEDQRDATAIQANNGGAITPADAQRTADTLTRLGLQEFLATGGAADDTEPTAA